MKSTLFTTSAAAILAVVAFVSFSGSPKELQAGQAVFGGTVTQGALLVRGADPDRALECPLKHTDVKAEISGFLARVTVTQEFENTASDKVEAVYVFPLPHRAAVDDMTLLVGDRTVKGLVKRREEARAIYDSARNSGRLAGLLDQERPNIFTQQVANIAPGAKVRVTISYVETLKYEAGTYEFTFPMVVGPRYIPGKPIGKIGGGWSHDTTRVPDASKITPIVTRPGVRAGHDISMTVSLDAGVPIENIAAPTHNVTIDKQGVSRAAVALKNQAELPNKDFVLRYDASGGKISDALLTHRSDKGGFFTLFLQPPDQLNVEDITPKELVFVLDTSGSMSGFPIEKAKETMRLAIDALNPSDRFNLITFSGDTHVLFPAPVAATRENVSRAMAFLESRRGGGGTEMMKAIQAALAPSESSRHVRVVCFMTDGYVGNEVEILSEITQRQGARIFSFGIGNSVNRYLLDKMAEIGRGEVEYVSLKDDGSAAAKRFHERVRNPLLTDISLEWNGLPVTDVLPGRIPDLFSAKPVVVSGRYSAPARGMLRIRGKYAGQPIVREVAVNFPGSEPKHDVLATLWARTKVDALMHEGANEREAITKLGLDFRLMTPFTSFVAVEEVMTTEGGSPRRVQVPVELPEGVSYEGVFGGMDMPAAAGAALGAPPPPPGIYQVQSSGVVGGIIASPRYQGSPVRNSEVLSDEKRKELGRIPGNKLDPALRPQNVAKLAVDGAVRVQVFLTEDGPQVMAGLRKLGFKLVLKTQTSLSVVGTISVTKLQALSELAAVRYVAPSK